MTHIYSPFLFRLIVKVCQTHEASEKSPSAGEEIRPRAGTVNRIDSFRLGESLGESISKQ